MYLGTIPILTCEFSYWYNLQSWGVCNVYMELDLKVLETEKWKHRKRYWLDLIRCQISANSLKIWHPAGTKNHSSNLFKSIESVELAWCGSLCFTERTKGWWLGIWTLIRVLKESKEPTLDHQSFLVLSGIAGSLKILKNPEHAVILIKCFFFLGTMFKRP